LWRALRRFNVSATPPPRKGAQGGERGFRPAGVGYHVIPMLAERRWTMTEIAEIVGVSRERVRQLRDKAYRLGVLPHFTGWPKPEPKPEAEPKRPTVRPMPRVTADLDLHEWLNVRRT